MGWHSSNYFRSIVMIGIALYIVDYIGILKHYNELNYDRYFDYPSGVSVHYNYTFIKNASEKCATAVPKIIIIVKSALENFDRRNSIRRTWGYEHRFSDVQIKRIFLLGASQDLTIQRMVDNESSGQKDIVQIDFRDAYFNNTIKTMMGMQWALRYCSESEFFFFVDDDYYVSTKNLLKFVVDPDLYPKHSTNTDTVASQLGDLYAGFVLQTAPHRHKFSKWYVPLSEYPFDLWPPYVTAGAFVLNKNALFKLFNTGINLKKFRFDDIFLGIAALKSGLALKHCELFYFNRPKYRGPISFQFIIASHGFQNNVELESIWNDCRSAGYA